MPFLQQHPPKVVAYIRNMPDHQMSTTRGYAFVVAQFTARHMPDVEGIYNSLSVQFQREVALTKAVQEKFIAPWRDIVKLANDHLNEVANALRHLKEFDFNERLAAQQGLSVYLFVQVPVGTEIGFLKFRNARDFEARIDPESGEGCVHKLGHPIAITVRSKAALFLLKRIGAMDETDFLFVSNRGILFSTIDTFGAILKRSLLAAGITITMRDIRNSWRNTGSMQVCLFTFKLAANR